MNRNHRFLSSIVAASFVPVIFRNADKDPSGGQAPKPPQPLEAQLSEMRTQLSAAQTKLATLEPQLATVTVERDTARTEAANLRSQFDAATEAATKAQTDLATAQQTIVSISAERDVARNQLTAAKANQERLESLCKVKGIKPDQAVPLVDDPAPTSTKSAADFDRELKAAKTPEDRAKIRQEFSAAVAAGKLKPAAK